MKHLIMFTFALLFLISCHKSETTFDEYQLVEALFDPGDGSGEYAVVQSNMKLLVFDDNTYETRNGSFCSSTDPSESDKGEIDYAEGKLTSESCESIQQNLIFVKENNYWMVYLPCIEPCILKFKMK